MARFSKACQLGATFQLIFLYDEALKIGPNGRYFLMTKADIAELLTMQLICIEEVGRSDHASLIPNGLI